MGTRPDVPNAVFLAGHYLGPRRRHTELVQWLQRALQHDPLNGLVRAILGFFLIMEVQYDQALDEMRTVLTVNDDVFSRASAHYVMAMVYSRMKQPAQALAAAERAYEAAPWHPRLIGMFASALALAGQHRRADEVIAQLRNTPAAGGVQSGMVHVGMAQYHLELGNIDGTIECLEKAVDQREPLALTYLGILPAELVRDNPRWAALLKTMNLPQAN